MEFPKTNHFDTEFVRSKIMGPNTLKLTEELLEGESIAPGSVVLDLGSGQGISSAMLAIPGMVRDCHDDLPACLLASWTPEQLDHMHNMGWRRAIFEQTPGDEVAEPPPCPVRADRCAQGPAPYASQAERAALSLRRVKMKPAAKIGDGEGGARWTRARPYAGSSCAPTRASDSTV